MKVLVSTATEYTISQTSQEWIADKFYMVASQMLARGDWYSLELTYASQAEHSMTWFALEFLGDNKWFM